MKIRWLNYINLIFGLLLIVIAIFNFIRGNSFDAILDIIASILNIFAFLLAVKDYWDYSPKINKKFIFTCPKCEHQFIPSFWTWLFVPHIFSMRYMKCEKCKKINWMRRK